MCATMYVEMCVPGSLHIPGPYTTVRDDRSKFKTEEYCEKGKDKDRKTEEEVRSEWQSRKTGETDSAEAEGKGRLACSSAAPRDG